MLYSVGRGRRWAQISQVRELSATVCSSSGVGGSGGRHYAVWPRAVMTPKGARRSSSASSRSVSPSVGPNGRTRLMTMGASRLLASKALPVPASGQQPPSARPPGKTWVQLAHHQLFYLFQFRLCNWRTCTLVLPPRHMHARTRKHTHASGPCTTQAVLVSTPAASCGGDVACDMAVQAL